MNKIKSHFISLLVLFFVNFIFFLPVFFPHLKLIVTPEYGGGDQVIFHYPIQYLFQKKLHQGEFLLWSNQIGGGYPIFAEQEVGFFNPINFLTLFLFPLPVAINIQIFIYFLILLFGSYYLGITNNLSRVAAIFFSLIFSYSFFNITNIIHHSHLASFSFIPIIFAFAINFLRKKNIKSEKKYLLILLISLFFQFIAGHLQYFFYSLILILSYGIFTYFEVKKKEKKDIIKKNFFLIVGIIFSLLLSSIQLLPTVEFYWHSFRSNISTFTSSNNLQLKDLLTFFYPFIRYDQNLISFKKNTMFLPPWDANLFIGFIPMIFFLLGPFLKRKEIYLWIKKNFFTNFILPFILIILAFGSEGPLHFLYTIIPFSFFRVPSRIIFLFLIFLALFISKIFDFLFTKSSNLIRIVFYFIILCQFFTCFFIMYKFHIFISFAEFIANKKTFPNFINAKKDFPLSIYFYEYFIPKKLFSDGFDRKKNSIFHLIKETVPQNFGLFYNFSYFNLPTSAFNLNRHTIYYRFLIDELKSLDESEKTNISLNGLKLLSLTGVTHVFSPYLIESTQSANFRLIKKNKEQSIFLYETGFKKNHPYFASQLLQIKTLNDFIENLSKFKKNIAFIESNNIHLNKIQRNQKIIPPKVKKFNDNAIVLETNNPTESFLVIPINFYPGWKIYVNQKEAKIYRANFLYFGAIIPKGKHQIKVVYEPISLKLGIIISLSSVVLLFIFFKNYRIFSSE